EAHITATSRSGKSNGAMERETVAWSGFMHDRAKSSRSGSPAKATSRPSASTTATSPACTDSSRPERITRTRGTGGMRSRSLPRSGGRERGRLPVSGHHDQDSIEDQPADQDLGSGHGQGAGTVARSIPRGPPPSPGPGHPVVLGRPGLLRRGLGGPPDHPGHVDPE